MPSTSKVRQWWNQWQTRRHGEPTDLAPPISAPRPVTNGQPISIESQPTTVVGGSQFPPISRDQPAYPIRANQVIPSAYWGDFKDSGPLPTNSWWLNLVLDQGTEPITPYPYLVKATDQGVHLCYPERMATADFVIQPFVDNWRLATREELTMRRLIAFDDLTATYQWSNNSQGSLTSTFVKGCPYQTFRVQALTLTLTTIHAVLELTSVSASKTTVRFNNGQTWALYHTQPLGLTSTINPDHSTTLVSQGPFTGVLRFALVPSSATPETQQRLDTHSATYVTGATVNWQFSDNPSFDLQYVYSTEGGDAGQLLMLALPHHQPCLVQGQAVNVDGYQCIKGFLKGVVGQVWTLRQTLNQIQWFAPNAIQDQDRSALHQLLDADVGAAGPVEAGDPYFFGKGIARLARLALIAEHADRKDLIPRVVEVMKASLEPWLKATNANSLTFDSTWKGLCSKNSMSNGDADFGNGRYNDHHFHYGYHVYAAATIGRYDAAWVQQFKAPILALVRDYANPSHHDPHFPYLRHMDLFDGHSWASGIIPFADGRNQESTSESLNAYYAMYLLGLIMDDPVITLIGNALTTMEIQATQFYWHMTTQRSVYEPQFAANKTVGILWNSKVDY
ncbi:hypothetical protein H4R35_005306, partial [Dimargaris xerosporica]